jgi:hypothetical protein
MQKEMKRKLSKTTLSNIKHYQKVCEWVNANFGYLVDGRIIDLLIVEEPRGVLQPDGTYDDKNTRYVWINGTNKYLAITYEGAKQ